VARQACGGDLWRHLRQAGKKRRKRYGAYDSRGRLGGKRHISERPPEVASRTEVGHWEIDTVMGNDRARHSVVTIVERATGYLQIGKLERHCAADTTNRCIDLIERQQARFATITADNGTEFHSYKDVEAATGVEFYFATPHHAWERGTNENTNGLIRQYLPKGPSMADLTQAGCDAIAAKLNSRPRKRLSDQVGLVALKLEVRHGHVGKIVGKEAVEAGSRPAAADRPKEPQGARWSVRRALLHRRRLTKAARRLPNSSPRS
jgi:IS30 family transposase